LKKNKSKISLNNTGAINMSKGKYKDAEKYFREAIKIAPNDYAILFNLGFALVKEKKYDEFGKWFDLAIENAESGKKAEIILDCGLACFEAKLYEQAEKYYFLAKAKCLESDEYWNRLGVLYFVTKKIDLAISCFEQAIEKNRNNIDAWFNLADSYEEAGMEKKSLEARKKFSDLEKLQK
jgi:Tfp pilus assembly protein PilF